MEGGRPSKVYFFLAAFYLFGIPGRASREKREELI
jgi:hypothetical protein